MRYILLTYLIISSFSLESYCQEMVQIPHQRTIAWKTKSDLANQVYQSFASKKINFDKLSERGNTPRILLAKLLLKQDIKNVNKAIQQMRVRGVTGSHWALNPKGDYDFTLMPLTTILFLFDNQPDLLYPKTKDHLINTLLTEEGGKYRRATPRTFGLVADTENHILMTEGSRYLKNRWKMLHGILSPDYDNLANGMEVKILAYLNRMKNNGLYEYNSIPYIGYTIAALLNLEAFASEKVSAEARNVLDYMNWTYALGTYKLRHYPPMRRRYEKAKIQELTTDYQSVFIKAWLSYAPVEPLNMDISNAEVHALAGSCMPYRPADKVVEVIFNKENGYFVKLGHGKKSCPEIFTAGKHFLLSAGGANQGKNSLVIARPTTLFLNDKADKLSETFHLTGKGNDFMKWNNTGVYKNFACASGKVSVPEDYKPILERNNWAIYAGNNNVKIVVYSTEDIGIMLIFEDMKAEDLLANLEKSNANDEQLKTQFQFPDGQIITYDVNAHLNKWVIKSIDGKSVERDFSKWALINFESGQLRK
jgi:hypothetical protein